MFESQKVLGKENIKTMFDFWKIWGKIQEKKIQMKSRKKNKK